MRVSFAVALVLVILLRVVICRRRGLALYPEETVRNPQDNNQTDRVNKAVDYTGKRGIGSEIPDANPTTKKPDFEKARIFYPTTTEKPKVKKTRIIYPTESGETVRGIRGKTVNVEEEKFKIPDSLLIAISSIRSTDEFLRRLVAPNKSAEAVHSSVAPGIASRKGLSGDLTIAPFASCQPQRTVVEVVNPPQSEGVLLWPPCIYLQRCGGCCTSELMMCRPTEVSTVNVTVLQARYTGPRSSPFTNEGVQTVTMEQHEKCACGCRELPEHCTALQEYRQSECRCVCSNQDKAARCQQNANKFWDSRDCICKCRTTRDCSSGLFFNVRTCRCEVMRLALAVRRMPFPHENETQHKENEKEEISQILVHSNKTEMEYG